MSFDKHYYQPTPEEPTPSEHNELWRHEHNDDEDDDAMRGFVNVMLITAGVAIIALSIWGLLKW